MTDYTDEQKALYANSIENMVLVMSFISVLAANFTIMLAENIFQVALSGVLALFAGWLLSVFVAMHYNGIWRTIYKAIGYEGFERFDIERP